MFRTIVEIPLSAFKITHQHYVMTLGSCFAENIGKKLNDAFFQVEVNPFGVLYNPVSIRNSIQLLLEKMPFSQEAIFENKGLWQSFSHSSQFSDTNKENCLTNINRRLESASEFFNKTDFLLITFGTAWVFEDRKSGSVVSNCHKLPANCFNRRRLTVDEIVVDYSTLITELKIKQPNLRIIFSVSPIRHWKDGAHENNISKSTLLLAVEALQQKFQHVDYFPAYEIHIDELRDYRFCAADMLHPSDVAVDYIWKRFSDTYFDEITIRMKKEFEQFMNDLSHRPLHPDSVEYKLFQQSIAKRKSDIQTKYPFVGKRIKYKSL